MSFKDQLLARINPAELRPLKIDGFPEIYIRPLTLDVMAKAAEMQQKGLSQTLAMVAAVAVDKDKRPIFNEEDASRLGDAQDEVVMNVVSKIVEAANLTLPEDVGEGESADVVEQVKNS